VPEVSDLLKGLPIAKTRTPYQVASDELSLVKIFADLIVRQRTSLLAVDDDMPDRALPSHKLSPKA
jgi:hypothetical protein